MNEPSGIEELSAEQVKDIRDKLWWASIMERRMSRYAADLQHEIVQMVPGADKVKQIEGDLPVAPAER